ncbi:alpha/beta hydrolase [Agromyces sp. H66]|uniref:alpha/beta hydrolase n=1 Tax=Agromyces sp. H66 TaxID=2529859 RepID=UPI0010AB212E|nr:alpha/beta hydrolase [Agromyces sp. H66]
MTRGTPPATTTRVEVRVLGRFEVAVDGVTLDPAGFARRDAAHLLKLLALTPSHRLHREQVIDALWPEATPESVANRLHKAAHFVRRATGRHDAIVLEGDTVALFPYADLRVDALEFEEAAGRATSVRHPAMAEAAVEAALAGYAGDLLPFDLYEDWTGIHRRRLQLLRRDLLRRAGRFEQLVAIDPTDEDAHVAIMRARLDAGDRTGALHQYDLLARTLEAEFGFGPGVEARELRERALDRRSAAARARESPPVDAEPLTQQVRFCTAVDGVRLAYATSGAGPPLVKASNWLTHLDHDWTSPVWRHMWQALSRTHTLVRYDERGCGLSDWDVDVESYALDAWVRDLETVVDDLGLERFPLLGISQGGPIAITYAARHPERVSHLIVFGTCARSTWARATDDERRELAALGELMKVSWGSEQSGFRQVYDARFLPDGPLDTWRAFDELQRRSTSPRNAFRLWRAFGSLDCTAEARRIDVPTLILHTTGDRVWSFSEAEELHAMVAGSRLVGLPGRNHILQADEPAFAMFTEEVERFLAE